MTNEFYRRLAEVLFQILSERRGQDGKDEMRGSERGEIMWIKLQHKSQWSDTIKLINGDQIRNVDLIKSPGGDHTVKLYITWANGEIETIASGSRAKQLFRALLEQLHGNEVLELELEGGEKQWARN